MLDDIKEAKPGEFYSQLKRSTRLEQGKSEVFEVKISNFSYQEQAELIADHHGKISNSYKGVKLKDIDISLHSQPKIFPSLPLSELSHTSKD